MKLKVQAFQGPVKNPETDPHNAKLSGSLSTSQSVSRNFGPLNTRSDHNLDHLNPDIGWIAISGTSNNDRTMNTIVTLCVISNNEFPV